MTGVKLTLDEVRDLAFRCLKANGCDNYNAAASANNMALAEGDGCASHGLFRLPWHVSSLRSGKANGRAKPRIETLARGVIKVHGDRGFAPLGHRAGREPLIGAARECGIAAMAYTNMYHIGALWPEIEALVAEGLVVFAFTASLPYVAPAGGTKPLFGTNPIGFGWPRGKKPPVVFDQASAAMARGEIMIAARDGHKVPEGAGIDAEGKPTTDPNEILKGAQLGFGGYKGALLAMMVELLAGPLIGDMLSIEALKDDAGAKAAPHGGELLLGLDPARFGDAHGFQAHSEKLFAAIAAQEGARLPGMRRYENRKKTATTGITIPKSLADNIAGLLVDS